MLTVLLLCSRLVFGQQNTKSDIEKRLKKIATALTDPNSTYLRAINTSESAQNFAYSGRATQMPFELKHYVYLKFFLDSSDVNNDGTAIVGKVFMSERYRESYFWEKLEKEPDFISEDTDGFYYYCKLYYNTYNGSYRLNIYPNYVHNICKKYMHFNKKKCQEGDLRTHDNTIRLLLNNVPDYAPEHFIVSNLLTSIERREINLRQFHVLSDDTDNNQLYNLLLFKKGLSKEEKTKLSKEELEKVDRADIRRTYRDSVKTRGMPIPLRLNMRKNTFFTILNYSNYIKVFEIDSSKNGSLNSLNLILSKNENNEDFNDKVKYRFEKRQTTLAKISPLTFMNTRFVEENNYINLNRSLKPDDQFTVSSKNVFTYYVPIPDGTSTAHLIKCLKNNNSLDSCFPEKEKLTLEATSFCLETKNDRTAKGIKTDVAAALLYAEKIDSLSRLPEALKSHFAYIGDSTLLSAKVLDKVNIKKKELLEGLFKTPFYVRNALPLINNNCTNKHIYKGKIEYIYKPFDIETKRIKLFVKNNTTEADIRNGKGYYSRIETLLQNQKYEKISQDDFSKINKASISENQNYIVKVTHGTEIYYWLNFSKNLYEELPRINLYFKKKIKGAKSFR